MTCVVMESERGRIAAIADRATGGTNVGSSSVTLLSDLNRKLIRRGPWLIGLSGHLRMIEIVRHELVPKLPHIRKGTRRERIFEQLHQIANCLQELLELRKCLQFSEHGSARMEGIVLLGVRGEIFKINPGFQVVHEHEGFAAIGSGGDKAGAVLSDLRQLVHEKRLKMGIQERLRRACAEAARTTGNVSGPFDEEMV